MFINYGDKNFFEYGVLLDPEHSDTVFPIIYCRPYDDEEDKYIFAECEVDIEESWIEKEEVMKYLGMTEENFHPHHYAIGCIEYYGVENFGGISYSYDYQNMNEARIKEILKHKLIAKNNINITW